MKRDDEINSLQEQIEALSEFVMVLRDEISGLRQKVETNQADKIPTRTSETALH